MSGGAEGLLLYRAAAAATVGARQVVGRWWPACKALKCRNAVQVGWGRVWLIGFLRLTSSWPSLPANELQLLFGTASPCTLAASYTHTQGDHPARLGWAGVVPALCRLQGGPVGQI